MKNIIKLKVTSMKVGDLTDSFILIFNEGQLSQ